MSFWRIIYSSIAICLASPVYSKPAECFVSIDGYDMMTGPCEMRKSDLGLLLMSGPDSVIDARNGEIMPDEMFVFVALESPFMHKAALWTKAGDHTHNESLGTVAPLDACWVNDRVRICAWPSSASSRPGAQ